jgi:hypothetical protein
MPTPIKYDNLYMHSEYGQKVSSDFKKYLTDAEIAYRDLCFEHDATTATIEALSTWFDDGNGGKVQFTSMPIFTYDEIYWESDDKSVVASKRKYAVTSADLPADFVTKAVKVS